MAVIILARSNQKSVAPISQGGFWGHEARLFASVPELVSWILPRERTLFVSVY
jgi:hypothetical protein